MLINENGINVGVVNSEDAKKMAQEIGLDLVEISPNSKPPVCKIMDYGKFKYETNLKQKENSKKQKSVKIKEIRLSPTIDKHDLSVKIASAKEFLLEGHKVQFKLRYKGRAKAHKDGGFQIINTIISDLSDCGKPQSNPKMDGDNLNCILEPIRNEKNVSNVSKKEC